VVVIFSVAVLPTEFMESQSYFNCGRRAAQFHPVVTVVSPLNAFDQIDAKNIRTSLGKRIVFQSKATVVSEEKLDEDKYDIRTTHCACKQL